MDRLIGVLVVVVALPPGVVVEEEEEEDVFLGVAEGFWVVLREVVVLVVVETGAAS